MISVIAIVLTGMFLYKWWTKGYTYLTNLLISLDQLANAILAGDRKETISSRSQKYRTICPLCNILCNLLHFIDTNHCEKSKEYLAEYKITTLQLYLLNVLYSFSQFSNAYFGGHPDNTLYEEFKKWQQNLQHNT